MTFVTERLIEPRLGAYNPMDALGHAPGEATDMPTPDDAEEVDPAAEGRGLRGALLGFLVGLAVVLVFTLPPGAPLRDPETGNIVGTTPFMDSLIFIISLLFLVGRHRLWARRGDDQEQRRRHQRRHQDLRRSGRARLHAAGHQPVHRLLQLLEHARRHRGHAGPGAARRAERAATLSCSILLILVIAVIDIIMPGVVAEMGDLRADLRPALHAARDRPADGPGRLPRRRFAAERHHPVDGLPAVHRPRRPAYVKSAGLGTIIALMIPYTVFVLVAWIILFVVWFVLGIPLGPGYPVTMP